LRKTHSINHGIYVFVRYSRFMQHNDRGINFLWKGERDQRLIFGLIFVETTYFYQKDKRKT